MSTSASTETTPLTSPTSPSNSDADVTTNRRIKPCEIAFGAGHALGLALLTSAEGLSNFTLLVDEVNALLGCAAALPSNAPEMREHADTLRARLAKIDALGLLVDDAALASSATHKKKSRTVAEATAASVDSANTNGASSKGSSLRRRKKKTAQHSGGVTESEDEEASDVADDSASSTSTAVLAATPAPQPQLRAWKQRVNALSQSMDVPGVSTTGNTIPDRRQSDDTLRKWKRNTMAMISATGGVKPSELKGDGGDGASTGASASGSGDDSAAAATAHTPGLSQSAGSSIRRWKREMSGEQADAFKRVIEERYGRNTSAAASFAQESAATAAVASSASANDLADEDDDIIVAAREAGVPKKASRRTDLLARFRREKSAIVSSSSSSSASAATSPSSPTSGGGGAATSQILGVPLASLAASTAVPDFILLSVSHLEANGLAEDVMFNCTDEVAINELERKIERGELSDLAAYKHAEVVAALIKRFLLRLPEPLMENHLLDNFVSCLTIADEFELCLELDSLLHQMPCRELSLLRFLLAFVVNRAKTTDVPYVCLWRAAEQLGQCLVRGSDARRSAAGAVTFALLRLYSGAFEPPVDRVQYLRDPETDAFVIRAAQPVVLLRKLVSPIWQDIAMVRRILLTHPLFVESHTLIAYFSYELRRAQRALDTSGNADTSAAGRLVLRLVKAVTLLLPLVSKEHSFTSSGKTPRNRADSTSAAEPTAGRDILRASTGSQLQSGSGGKTKKGTALMPLLPLAGVSMRSDDAPSPSLIGRSPERVAVPPAASVVVDGGDAIQVALLEFARVAEKCSISAAKTLAFDIVGKHLRPLGGAAHAAHKAALADAAAAAEAAKSPRILPTTPRTDATVWHKFSPADVARELTLWDHELFHAVPSTEFLRMSFTERERSPAFHAASDRFNAMARWAATEVLLRDTVALRAHQIERMMDVAEECRALSNFQGACAIVMGLTSTPIERLADEWERVPSKRRAKYDKLKAVFDMDRNFQAYRDALRGATPPIVPYLALISKYLFAIESHNDDFFEPQRPMRGSTFLLQITPTEAPKPQAADAANAAAAAAGAEELAHHIGADAPAPVRKLLSERRLVNCDKMLMLSQLIAEIESYQASQYAFASDTVLRVALTEAPIMTDEELFARSNLYRPGRSSRKATLARDTERNASGPDSDAASSVADDAASSVADDAEVSGGSATSARSEASGDAEDAGAAAAAADDDAANDDKSGGATPH